MTPPIDKISIPRLNLQDVSQARSSNILQADSGKKEPEVPPIAREVATPKILPINMAAVNEKQELPVIVSSSVEDVFHERIIASARERHNQVLSRESPSPKRPNSARELGSKGLPGMPIPKITSSAFRALFSPRRSDSSSDLARKGLESPRRKDSPKDSPKNSPKNSPKVMRTDSIMRLDKGKEKTPSPKEQRRSPGINSPFSEAGPITHIKKTEKPPFNESLLSYIKEIPNKLFYDECKSALELAECIRNYPESKIEIVSFLQEIRKSLPENKKHRVDQTVALLLCNPKNFPFLRAYFNCDCLAFESFIRSTLNFLNGTMRHSGMIDISICLTQEDLNTQKEKSLFQEDCFSSVFCKLYAAPLLADSLKNLKTKIEKELRNGRTKSNHFLLYLDYNKVKERLQKQSDFAKLDSKTQAIQIEDAVRLHRAYFQEFADIILTYVCKMKIPSDLQELLRERRKLVINFLRRKKEEAITPRATDLKDKKSVEVIHVIDPEIDYRERSRKGSVDILWLRLINPFLLIGSDDGHNLIYNLEVRPIMISLTKMMQHLSNESEFEEGEVHYTPLNSLLNQHRSNYKRFIDENSL